MSPIFLGLSTSDTLEVVANMIKRSQQPYLGQILVLADALLPLKMLRVTVATSENAGLEAFRTRLGTASSCGTKREGLVSRENL